MEGRKKKKDENIKMTREEYRNMQFYYFNRKLFKEEKENEESENESK
jgi:hypothetical protein